MPGFVVDASVTLAWLFDAQDYRDWIPGGLDQASMAAPWLWRLEVANTILVKERRGLLSAADGTRFLQVVDALEIDVVGEPTHRSMESFAHFARPHPLTSYDALYLELAISLNLPLCTFDRNIQNAARRLGVDLVVDDRAS